MRTRSMLIGASAAAALLLTACGSGSGSGSSPSAAGSQPAASGAAGAGSELIGVDYPRSDTDFWNAYVQYVPTYATELGANITTTNSQNEIQKLVSNIQTLTSQGAKAMVIAPQDTAAIGPALTTLNNSNIPVVSIDTRPDTGKVFMVVRADNVQLGEKACEYLGEQLAGKGSVVNLQGDTASVNGRDRSDGFNNCMTAKFPGIKVVNQPSKWDGALAASQLQTALTQDPDIRGVYMASSFALAGTQQVLKQAGLTAPAGDPNHVYVVSNDGIPQEYADIKAGTLDATVSQPADQYAKYGLFYAQAALEGKTFAPGKTDHDSTIVQVRDGVLEDQLSSQLVTKDNVDDKSLWGNNLGK